MPNTRTFSFHRILFPAAALAAAQLPAQPTEDDYYPMYTVPTPEGVLLEVGGLSFLPEGRLAVSTRRGEVWIISNPSDIEHGVAPSFKRYAQGLHEPLGLLYYQRDLYAAQRGELTRMIDFDGDEVADSYQTVAKWPLSSHYHEYSFGPKLAPDGTYFVTANVAFGDQEWWRGESRVPWRGWAMKIHPDGKIEPWATGLRSPAGLGMFEGELFYTDNQGDWIGSGAIWHLPKGAFVGHPAGLRWTNHPDSPVSLSEERFNENVDQRRFKEDGLWVMPYNIRDEKDPMTVAKLKTIFPETQLPSVILPHGILGVSNSEILANSEENEFGPFSGQLFVGDQGQSKIMRVSLEKIDGAYQGVAFDFRTGFQSGILRLAWGRDGTLFAGQTDRGWGSAGESSSGLQFIKWNGETPFEMQTVKAMPDGFEITFTLPIDKEKARDLNSYSGRSYTYKYHPVYGSPQLDSEQLEIVGVSVSDDGLKARLVVNNLRKTYVHEIHAFGLADANAGNPLLHPSFYYTLNAIPEGTKLAADQVSSYRSETVSAPVSRQASGGVALQNVDNLLRQHTCVACHAEDKKVVGPSFTDIAKRNYTTEQMIQLIYEPKPENWPDYPTPMPPMEHVPSEDLAKIAQWINSLNPSALSSPDARQ